MLEVQTAFLYEVKSNIETFAANQARIIRSQRKNSDECTECTYPSSSCDNLSAASWSAYGSSVDVSKPSTTSIKSSLSKKKSLYRKKVRFAVVRTRDNVEGICCTMHDGWQEPFSIQEKKNIWYSPFEYQSFAKSVQRGAITALQNKDFTNSFLSVYQGCRDTNISNNPEFVLVERQLIEFCNYRGLEPFIFKTLKKNREQYITYMLTFQKAIRRLSDDEKATMDDIEIMIATASMVNTQYSRIMARVHGLNDAELICLCDRS